MLGIIELLVTSALLWAGIQVIGSILINIFCNFSIPWIVWGTFVIAIGLKVIRIPPPDPSIVQEVLGTNPVLLKRESIATLIRNNEITKNYDNEEGYCMRVVAHRGAAYDYPENSLTAFRNTIERGCSAVEFDLSLTKDNVPIVFHDQTIERLTGKIGIVKEMTWDQLNHLDITGNHPLKEKFLEREHIPIFWDVLEMCLSHDQRIIIDVKDSGNYAVQLILDAYKKYPKLYERGVISSFNPVLVYKVRRREPRIVGSIAWRPDYFAYTSFMGSDGVVARRYKNIFKYTAAIIFDYVYEWLLYNVLYYVTGVSVLLLHKDVLNLRILKEWENRDMRVIAWTVNRPSEKLHFSRFFEVTYLTDTL